MRCGDLLFVTQGQTGRPGLIGQPGGVGEKVRKHVNHLHLLDFPTVTLTLVPSLRGRMARQETLDQSDSQEGL